MTTRPTQLARMTWTELRLFAREPFSVVFAFAFPVIVLVVLTASFGTVPEDREAFGGQLAADYYASSYAAVVIGALGLIVLPVHLASYRERGILRRFRASSVPLWTIFGAQLVVGLLVAATGAAIVAVLGHLVYGAAFPALGPQTLAAFILATLSFLAVGFLLGSVARTARAAQALGLMLFFPMWLLSGAGPPPDIMGTALKRVSDILPLTFVVRSLQEPWLDTGFSPIYPLLLTAILVVAAALSVRSLRMA